MVDMMVIVMVTRGHVVADHTTSGRAQQRVMTGEVADDTADNGPADAAPGVSPASGARHREGQNNRNRLHDP